MKSVLKYHHIHRLIKQFNMLGRFQEWWSYKTPILLAIMLSTTLLFQLRFSLVWESLLLILVALIIGGVYAYAVNDVSDIREDALRNKTNFFLNKGLGFRFLIFLLLISLGLVIIYFFQSHHLVVWIYMSNWLVFAMYSLKPTRLKERGFMGILFGTLGDSLLPNLFCIFVIGALFNKPLPLLWVLGISIWALALGIKYMIGHQLNDANDDIVTGTKTFVTSSKRKHIFYLVHGYFFPLEIIGLVIIFYCLSSFWLMSFLCLQLWSELFRSKVFNRQIAIIYPQDQKQYYVVFLQEFYEIFFPLGILIELTVMDYQYIFIVMAFLIAFYSRIAHWFREMTLARVTYTKSISKN